MIDDARSEVSVGGWSLHGLGERLVNNTHLKSLVTIRGAESSNWTSPPISRNQDGDTPAESVTTEKLW
ncbi:MAG: hypothetical protein ACRD15_11015 [Vicinamibacterales bacterium]